MRTLLITLLAKPIGGLEIYNRDIAFSLRRLGHTVSVISALEQPKPYPEWEGIPVHALAPRDPLLHRLHFRLWRWVLAWKLSLLKSQFDLLLIMHPYAAISAYRARSPKYIVWTYGIDVWGDWSLGLRTGLQNAQRIVAISTHTRNIVIDHLPGKIVDLVHPVADTKRFTVANTLRLSTIPFRLLTVGRLASGEAYKGHDVVIRNLEAIQRRVNAPVEYWIAGDGDDRLRLENLAREHRVQESVHFLGRVSDNHLVELYQNCDVFVMPSAREGFGIVYIEAGACGKPVVGSSVGGATDAIQDGITGFCIDPKSGDELVHAVSQLLLHPEMAREFGLAGRRRVEKEFSFQALDETLRRLLSEI